MYIKCHCGFEEKPSKVEEIQDVYVRGPNKGQPKGNPRTEYHDAIKMDSIEIKAKGSNPYDDPMMVDFKVCPECKLVYYDGWW